MERPDWLKQGDRARLFPVLSNTSREGRTTSVFLSCLEAVSPFRARLLRTIGAPVGKRASLTAFTEIVFNDMGDDSADRPDGLLIVRSGKNQWTALVEAKVGTSKIDPDQIERYRQLAKKHGIDAVISVSNQFAADPSSHPDENVRKSRSKVPVFHWSWMYVLTAADLLFTNEEVEDSEQQFILREFRRFLMHESAGVRGFERMPPEWTELNRLVAAGGTIPSRSQIAEVVAQAWFQETKDLSLILSRQMETIVKEKLTRKHVQEPALRIRDAINDMRESGSLYASFDVPDAASPVEVVADLPRRTIEVGMSLKAPEDKVSSRARVNWLLRQIKTPDTDDVFIRLLWPGSSEATQFELASLLNAPEVCDQGKSGLQVRAFRIFYACRLGARFAQQANFISELEAIVPKFYREIGQNLAPWRRRPPKIKQLDDDADSSMEDSAWPEAAADD